MTRVLMLAAVIFLSSFYGFSTVNDEVQRAAQKGLSHFLGLIPAGQETVYGFSTEDKLSDCTVGKPFQTMSLSADFYGGTYTAGRNYLVEGKTWRVPVVANGAYRILLTVAGEADNYSAVEIGGAGLATELQQAITKANAGDNYYILRVHLLSSDFFVDAASSVTDARFIPLSSALRSMPVLKNRSYPINELLPIIKAAIDQTKN